MLHKYWNTQLLDERDYMYYTKSNHQVTWFSHHTFIADLLKLCFNLQNVFSTYLSLVLIFFNSM